MSSRALPRVLLAALVLVLVITAAVVALRSDTPTSRDAGVSGPSTTGAPPLTATASQNAVPPAASQAARKKAVQQLLDQWAVAVRSNDSALLATLFDTGADVGFPAAEARRAANLAQVPLADWGYDITEEAVPTVDPAVTARLGADEVWSPPVVLRYAIAGADAASTTRPVGVVLARRGQVWRLVSDTAADRYGRSTWRGLWDFGPVIARVVPQGVVLGHPSRAADLDLLAKELGPAVAAVTDFWGPGWQQRAAVFLPDHQDELRALVGPDFAEGEIAAVSIADNIDRSAGTVRGQRVVFNPATLSRLTPLSRRVVLRHELTHVAARAATSAQAPVWLAEGFADYVGYRASGVSLSDGAPAVAAVVRSAGPPDSLPVDTQFATTTSGAKVELAYQLSWSFAVFLAATRGEDALRGVYLAVAALPAPSTAEIDAAVQPVLGVSLGALLVEWGRWLQQALD
ncbi:hypothetical protein [Rhodococcus sp. X156]|uniref:hypothetical protein n=1 Tax=Rhodococcus sp. X156 TaxID=2499145 RepID=UPI001F49E974|nr:hypothetical protein [Rhodococcus sp. X156]